MPQPTDEPTSRDAIKTHLGIELTDTRDDVFIDSVAAATNSFVRGTPIADIDASAWPERVELGSTMLAARLVRRRNSPDGVQALTEQGAAFVSRSDPDVAMLLELGAWSRPVAK